MSPTAKQPLFSESAKDDCLQLIKMALVEDTGAANLEAGVDCTTDALVPQKALASAALVSRDAGVVCGVEIARLAIAQWAPQLSLDVQLNDGNAVGPRETIAVMRA